MSWLWPPVNGIEKSYATTRPHIAPKHQSSHILCEKSDIATSLLLCYISVIRCTKGGHPVLLAKPESGQMGGDAMTAKGTKSQVLSQKVAPHPNAPKQPSQIFCDITRNSNGWKGQLYNIHRPRLSLSLSGNRRFTASAELEWGPWHERRKQTG